MLECGDSLNMLAYHEYLMLWQGVNTGVKSFIKHGSGTCSESFIILSFVPLRGWENYDQLRFSAVETIFLKF